MPTIENFSMREDQHTAKKILSFEIGLENNGENLMKGIAEVIFKKLEDVMRSQIVDAVRQNMPYMLEKLGSDVAIAGLKELLKEEKKT